MMTDASNPVPPPSQGPPPEPRPHPFPADWREALLNLLSARAALVEIEARDLARTASLKLLRGALALLAIGVTWLLILAGGIGAISAATQFAWYWLALIAAGLHIVVAASLARSASKPMPPAFSHARSEFQKDREWIRNLCKTRKSND